jgi:hypothetical protein
VEYPRQEPGYLSGTASSHGPMPPKLINACTACSSGAGTDGANGNLQLKVHYSAELRRAGILHCELVTREK